MSTERWTPDLLLTPADRALHLEQRRAQLHPIVDDLRRLAREMEAATKEAEAIEGDLPMQSRARAWHVTRPLFKAADDVERALSDLIAFNARFKSSYEDLPKKRAEKREKKALAKGGEPQAIESSQVSEEAPEKFGSVFDRLRKGA
ncbi:hypothetical protein BX261_7269 [Streptomyces sp. 2321.6]|uniref:hypothetical protein n=1 Tax=Streptomyces sp. 2321.6 TaxID=1938840 RepID=UPI000BB131A6|nr:hypothetical protein [Streptomyces sp. 2321.6]PBC72395.1 hypothetical protein BX261_7269 [Streptomyces sp. 2321.6]